MESVIDAKEGDEYSIVEPGLEGRFAFVRMNKNGSIVLRNVETDEIKKLSFKSFARMRGVGSAVRVVREYVETKTESLGPFYLLDPDDPKITQKERSKRCAARKRITKARLYHLCLKLFDEDETATTYEPSLQRFREKAVAEAKRQGFETVPSTSQIRKALRRFGTSGNRPLGQILGDIGVHKNTSWPKWVDNLKVDMIEYYLSKRNINIDLARARFVSKYDEYCKTIGISSDDGPAPQTLLDWINKSATKERWQSKFGKRDAHKRFEGTTPGIVANRPLEYVVLDQTLTDLWLVVKDAAGEVVTKKRAWLVYALDLFSDMVLGKYLTFESPSVHTLMKCIQLVSQPNYDLEDEFGYYKGATDGWGHVSCYVLDNGMENIGVSLKTVMEYVGTEIRYAAIATPEHKTKTERIFGTTNTALWHQLPGGRPGGADKRRLRDDHSRDDAYLTLPQANRKLGQYIVTTWHIEPKSDGLVAAPAKRFHDGIVKFGRPTLDDPKLLDKLAGTYGRAILTTSGIRFKGETYHDPHLVSLLIRNMAFLAKKRKQRDRGQTIILDVNTFHKALDCSFLQVLDETTGQLVRVPNIHPEATRGLSFAMAKELRAFSKARNLATHTDVERAHARWKLHEEYEENTGNSTERKGHRKVEDKRLSLAEDFDVEEVKVRPSIHGMVGVIIPIAAPMSLRKDHGLSPKDAIRGSKKRVSRSPQGKIDDVTEIEGAVESTSPPVTLPSSNAPRIEISQSLKAEIGEGDLPAPELDRVEDIQAFILRRAADKSRRLQ